MYDKNILNNFFKTSEGQRQQKIMTDFNNLSNFTTEKEGEDVVARFIKLLDPTITFIPRGFCVKFPSSLNEKVKVPDCLKNRVFFSGDVKTVDLCEPMRGARAVPKIIKQIKIPDIEGIT